MGGNAVLYAGANLTPAVDGVVRLSAPATYGGIGVLAEVKKMTVPVYFSAAKYDDGFSTDAQDLYAACTSTDKKLDMETGGDHGWGLLNDKTAAIIEGFLKAR